jgi:hypothetical protein
MKQISNVSATDIYAMQKISIWQHADEVKRESVAKHARVRVQIVSEVLENRQIDYKNHMMRLRR